jgi:malate:Na+ symporter
MDRQVLIKGFLKTFVPMLVGSVAAGAAGTLVGVALGLGAYYTFFYIVVPIMEAASVRARSRCRSAIPRSCTWNRGVLFAQVLPPIMLGSLTAMVC